MAGSLYRNARTALRLPAEHVGCSAATTTGFTGWTPARAEPILDACFRPRSGTLGERSCDPRSRPASARALDAAQAMAASSRRGTPMSDRISILLVEDLQVVRQALRAQLAAEPSLLVVGEAAND